MSPGITGRGAEGWALGADRRRSGRVVVVIRYVRTQVDGQVRGKRAIAGGGTSQAGGIGALATGLAEGAHGQGIVVIGDDGGKSVG